VWRAHANEGAGGRRKDLFSGRSGFPLPVLNRAERAGSPSLVGRIKPSGIHTGGILEVAAEILFLPHYPAGHAVNREARSRGRSGMLGHSLSSPLLLKHYRLSAIREFLNGPAPPMRR
jgi:hypothetical protein